jgi:hypothetical protein
LLHRKEGSADRGSQRPNRRHSTAQGLVDGRDVVGFICELGGLDGAEDITAHGGWRAYTAAPPTA